MPLKSLISLGVAAACVLAVAPGADASASTAPSTTTTTTTTTTATVVTTTPSDSIGGLPASSLDGRIDYVPRSPAKPAALGAQDPGGATGYDISWPECGGPMPPASSIAVVGADGGHPFSQNPCLQQEAAWAATATTHAQYMVLDSPIGFTSPHVLEYAYHGPAGDCTTTEFACQSFNWGYNAAYFAVQSASAAGATSSKWWLDIELPTSSSIDPPGAQCYTPNFWICDQSLNSIVVAAAEVALRAQGKDVGVYSTQKQWGAITGGLPLGGPIWIAGYDYPASTYCDVANAGKYWFAAGAPDMVQSLPATYDPDTAC
jgi:hypothetical protein